MTNSKPEWHTIQDGGFPQHDTIEWCAGCGCLKITRPGRKPTYRVPRREAECRVKASGGFIEQDEKKLNECCGPAAIFQLERNRQREFGGAG